MQKDFKGSMSNEISEDFLDGVSGGSHGGYVYKNYATGEYGVAVDNNFKGGFETQEEAVNYGLSEYGYNTPFLKDTTAGTQLGYTKIGSYDN